MHVVVNDGEPYTLFTTALDCRGFNVFTQLSDRLDLTKLPGPWARGELSLLAAVTPSPTAIGLDYLTLDVNVLGMRGGASTIISRHSFSGNRNQAIVPVDYPYEAFFFEGRQMFNGLGDFVAANASMLTVTIVGRFWR